MDVTLTCVDDHANVSKRFEKALKAVGVEAKALALNKHPFGYTEQAQQATPQEMRAWIERSQGVLFCHSRFIKTGANLKGLRVGVFNGGGDYRNRVQAVNQRFNPIVKYTITQTGDLLGLGARHEIWEFPPVEADKLKPKYHAGRKKLVVGHFPRGPYKGTKLINQVVRNLAGHKKSFVYNHDEERKPWNIMISRLAECDIYIEALNRVGEFGMTGFEAAALGCIVITNFMASQHYIREFGEHPLLVANNSREVAAALVRVLGWSTKEIKAHQKKTRAWVEDRHSLIPTGKRLKKIVL